MLMMNGVVQRCIINMKILIFNEEEGEFSNESNSDF